MKDHKKEKHGVEAEDIKKTEEVPVTDSGQVIEDDKASQIEKLNEKLDALNDKYIRLAAEFDNYRRRTAKERLDLVLSASEDTISGIIPVLDDLERALELLRKTEGDHSVAIEGTELIYNKLLSYLTSKGLKTIDAKGHELNTDFHEAIAQLPAPDKKSKNKIIEVVQKGYTLNSKVIRFAKVVVGI